MPTTNTQVLAPYEECLAKLKDSDVVPKEELEKAMTSDGPSVTEIVQVIKEALRSAQENAKEVVVVVVKVCFSACAQRINCELSPAAPWFSFTAGISTQCALNLTKSIMMCEVYNELAREKNLYTGDG